MSFNHLYLCTASQSLPSQPECRRMSANYNNADSGYPTGYQSTSRSRSNPVPVPRGMEVPHPVYSSQSQPPVNQNQTRQVSPTMSTLTMRAPAMFRSPTDVGQGMPWSDRLPLELPSRPRNQTDREELPSIRQVFKLLRTSAFFCLPASRLFQTSTRRDQADRIRIITLILIHLHLDLDREGPHQNTYSHRQ